MNAGCSEVMADANSGGYVKQVNIAICTQIGVPVETFASRILAYGGIAMLSSSASPPSIHSARPRCARGHFLSFGRAHVHLNLVDMTTPCAAKGPVLEPLRAVAVLRIFVLDWHIEHRISGMVGGNIGFSISDMCAPDDPVTGSTAGRRRI